LQASSGKSRTRRRPAKEHGPDPVDIHVGRRLRIGRELAGLTQTGIGKELGMSFQVVQKYEQGEIRISASRLYQLAKLLAKPVAYFFEGLETSSNAAVPPEQGIVRREIELVRAFRLIDSPEVQQRLLLLMRDVGERHPA